MSSPKDVRKGERKVDISNKSVSNKVSDEDQTTADFSEQIATTKPVSDLKTTSVLKKTDVLAHNVEVGSIEISENTVISESNTVFEILAVLEPDIGSNVISEFSAVSQTTSISEPVLLLQTTSVPEKYISSVQVLEQSVDVKSVKTLDEITTASNPSFEPGSSTKSMIYSETVPVLETIAVLEEDVGFKECVEQESNTVIEIIANSQPHFKRNIVSELDAISEAIPANQSSPVFETAAVSEQSGNMSSTSVSKESSEQNSIAVFEIDESSYPDFQPRPLNITFSNRAIKSFHPNFSVTDLTFCKIFDVSNFEKDSISVNIIGNIIDVYGIYNSEDWEECHEIHEHFSIPELVEDDFNACVLENDMLVLEAPMK